MGAWGEDTFGNDAACDWVGVFLQNPGLPTVKSALEAVLNADDILDSDTACGCLAACEVIARQQRQWGMRNAYSMELDRWIETNPMEIPDALRLAANSAIERIVAPGSELQNLWDEHGYDREWHHAIEDLQRRVKGKGRG